jgi:hypothetical protein
MSDFWSQRIRPLRAALSPRYPHITTGDEVVVDVRRHPITLVVPVLRTALGLLVLSTGGSSLQFVVLFALSVAGWARARLQTGLRMSLVTAAVPTLLLLISAGGVAVLAGIGLLAWVLEDVADWYTDRLVVTRRRIYRLYGVFTQHSPSMALPSVAFIDALETPLGRLLGYGTILLDSVAQRDVPLSRFDRLPDASHVHVRILELRSAAMPRFPASGQPPY